MQNFNDSNLENVRAALERKKKEKKSKAVFAMLQRSASCRVTITEESMKKCAEALTAL